MPQKFGWCMDGDHNGCRVHYRDWYEPEKLIECGCECHVGKKKPPLPPMHTPPKDAKSQRGRKRRVATPQEQAPQRKPRRKARSEEPPPQP